MLSTNLVVFDDTHTPLAYYLCAFAYVVAFWLHDEVARVQGANSEVHRELRRELIEREQRNDEIMAELREQVTRLNDQNDAASVKMHALEAELDLLPAQLEGLRRGIHEVVTQLHDEIARVQGANSEVHRELRRELIERHQGRDRGRASRTRHETY